MGLQEDIKRCKSPTKSPLKAYKAVSYKDKNNKEIVGEVVECDLINRKEKIVFQNKEYAKLKKKLNNK